MKKWLFNPFVYVAGTKALVIGWMAMLVTAVVCNFSNAHFDGVIDMHAGHASPAYVYFMEASIDWAVPVVLFFIAGRIFSRSSVRLIDIAGTLALSRWVTIFPALLAFGIHTPAVAPVTIPDLIKSITPTAIAFGLISFLFMIWMIALMYNAFTTSCNLKGSKAIMSFIVALLISEILSKVILALIS